MARRRAGLSAPMAGKRRRQRSVAAPAAGRRRRHHKMMAGKRGGNLLGSLLGPLINMFTGIIFKLKKGSKTHEHHMRAGTVQTMPNYQLVDKLDSGNRSFYLRKTPWWFCVCNPFSHGGFVTNTFDL